MKDDGNLHELEIRTEIFILLSEFKTAMLQINHILLYYTGIIIAIMMIIVVIITIIIIAIIQKVHCFCILSVCVLYLFFTLAYIVIGFEILR